MFDFLWSGANESSKRPAQAEEPQEQSDPPEPVVEGVFDSLDPSLESVLEILPERSAAEPSATQSADPIVENSPPSVGPLPRLPGRRRGRRRVKPKEPTPPLT